jgi:hypothetical protein
MGFNEIYFGDAPGAQSGIDDLQVAWKQAIPEQTSRSRPTR